ncbi:MAG: hypothetical protein PUA83_09810 [Clostridiales bacterium]|nr:hypothetical protein [Clostridiales bacterium]
MRDFFTLYRALFRGHLGLDSLSGGGGRGRRILAAVLVVVFTGFFFLTEVYLLVPLAKAAVELEYPVLFVESAVLLACVPGFLFGFYGVLRCVCFAGDIVLLASLPVRRVCIYRSKTALAYTECFAACAAVILPALCVYARFVETDVFFWLRAVFMLVMYPMLLMFAATLVAVPVALLSGSGRTVSSLFKYAALVTVPVIDVVFAVLCVMAGPGGQEIAGFFSSNWAQIKNWSVPPLSWASISVCSGGMTSAITILLFAVTAILAGIFMNWILRTVFVRRISRALATPADKAMK